MLAHSGFPIGKVCGLVNMEVQSGQDEFLLGSLALQVTCCKCHPCVDKKPSNHDKLKQLFIICVSVYHHLSSFICLFIIIYSVIQKCKFTTLMKSKLRHRQVTSMTMHLVKETIFTDGRFAGSLSCSHCLLR